MRNDTFSLNLHCLAFPPETNSIRRYLSLDRGPMRGTAQSGPYTSPSKRNMAKRGPFRAGKTSRFHAATENSLQYPKAHTLAANDNDLARGGVPERTDHGSRTSLKNNDQRRAGSRRRNYV